MKNECIKLLLKKFESNGERLNYIQDIMDELRSVDKIGTDNFFIKLNKDIDSTDCEDGMTINSVYFDWKDFEKVDVLHAMLNLVQSKLSDYALKLFYNKIMEA